MSEQVLGDRIVVDASVAVKWYLPEAQAEEARRLLQGSWTLLVPDLLFTEVTNVLWKKARFGELTAEDAQAAVSALDIISLRVYPTSSLMRAALDIGIRTGRTVYDSVYLALAIRENVSMVTADERFFNAIKATPLSSHITWVEDL
jgi:predicted nucleic acid-binding protein